MGNIFLIEWKLGKEREYNRIEAKRGGRERRGIDREIDRQIDGQIDK